MQQRQEKGRSPSTASACIRIRTAKGRRGWGGWRRLALANFHFLGGGVSAGLPRPDGPRTAARTRAQLLAEQCSIDPSSHQKDTSAPLATRKYLGSARVVVRVAPGASSGTYTTTPLSC